MHTGMCAGGSVHAAYGCEDGHVYTLQQVVLRDKRVSHPSPIAICGASRSFADTCFQHYEAIVKLHFFCDFKSEDAFSSFGTLGVEHRYAGLPTQRSGIAARAGDFPRLVPAELSLLCHEELARQDSTGLQHVGSIILE